MSDKTQTPPAPKRGREERKRRVTFGDHRAKLHVTGLPPGMVPRWINDEGGRLETMQDRGYQFIGKGGIIVGEGPEDGDTGIDSRISTVVGRSESGQPIRAYLMATKKEFFEEDSRAKEAEISETENAILRSEIARTPGDGRYKPSTGVSIKRQYNP